MSKIEDVVNQKLDELLKLTTDLKEHHVQMAAQLKGVTADVACLKMELDSLRGAATEPAAKTQRTDGAKSEKPKSKATPTAAGGGMVLHVIPDYSDKAMVVYGKEACMALKDRLFKPQKFKFNGQLSCGAGWIVPRSKVSVAQLQDLVKADADGHKITIVLEHKATTAPTTAVGDKRKTSDGGSSDE